MTIIILLIAISLSIAILFLFLFYRGLRDGQFEDTYTPSLRILFEDDVPVESLTEENHDKSHTGGGG